jgi:hypothetical protein
MKKEGAKEKIWIGIPVENRPICPNFMSVIFPNVITFDTGTSSYRKVTVA